MSDNEDSNRAKWFGGSAILVVVGFVVFLWVWVHPSLDATKVGTELVGKLAWPIVALVGLILFRHSITHTVSGLLSREEVKLSAPGFTLETKTFREDVAEELSEPVEESLGPYSGNSDEGSAAETALLDVDPNMAMLSAFISLERLARKYFQRFSVSDGEASRHVPLIKVIQHVDDPSVQKLFTYINQVRNGIAHGEAPSYNRGEGARYMKECAVVEKAISRPNVWRVATEKTVGRWMNRA